MRAGGESPSEELLALRAGAEDIVSLKTEIDDLYAELRLWRIARNEYEELLDEISDAVEALGVGGTGPIQQRLADALDADIFDVDVYQLYGGRGMYRLKIAMRAHADAPIGDTKRLRCRDIPGKLGDTVYVKLGPGARTWTPMKLTFIDAPKQDDGDVQNRTYVLEPML